uniref:Leukotriene A-4 hydrolase n=2 Tax=Cacopsylla melanoneura TaxID=428564 RepID=A0A8D8PRL4_9HEMI
MVLIFFISKVLYSPLVGSVNATRSAGHFLIQREKKQKLTTAPTQNFSRTNSSLDKMSQSEARISNSLLLSHDNEKMFKTGGIFKKFNTIFKSTSSNPVLLFSDHLKCSYLLTVLLFKYTSASANLRPDSCNNTITQTSHHQNLTILPGENSFNHSLISPNLNSFNHSLGEGDHLNNRQYHTLSNHTTPLVTQQAHTYKRLSHSGLQSSPQLLLGSCQGRNYSSCSHRQSAHHHQLSTHSGHKKIITMADGPFSPGDPNSFSRPELAEIKHIDLCLDVDFDTKVLCGEATYAIHVKKPDVSNVIMDVHNLTIFEILDKKTQTPLNYTVGQHVDNFGSKLDITLPADLEARHHQVDVTIKYKTAPTSSALQWLEPAQTAGKTKPYLFSQCQPIHARSMLPVQDTPSVKQTYTATINAPKDLTVLMSALKPNELENYFYQPITVPSYLIAIVVGNLANYKLSERCSVWSEPELVKDAAYEFSETETFLKTAESICGTYVWKVYDIVMLPPSFPFGGMENPCLTFVTPTLLAGDKSLASVVAHEISHSWTGNLVTNRNFEHFWLNEGFTMFVERKIAGRLKGEAERHFDALSGLKDLKQALKNLGESNPLTKLIVDLKHTHPDDAFSTCPYEKGHTFLFYLEQLLGGPQEFEPWLKKYLQEFALKSIDTDSFKTHLLSHFAHKEQIKEIDWDLWLNSTGMPPIIPKYDTSLQDACADLASRWISWNQSVTPTPPFEKQDLAKFSPGQKIEFLAILLDKEFNDISKVQALQETYNLNRVKNCEIRFRWLKLCLKSKWKEQVPLVVDMVTSQGRMKYVRPLYRELYAWEDTRKTAIDTFQAHRNNMMHVTAYTVAKDLKLEA